jgi:hypothetical protein
MPSLLGLPAPTMTDPRVGGVNAIRNRGFQLLDLGQDSRKLQRKDRRPVTTRSSTDATDRNGRFLCLAYQLAYHNPICTNHLNDINRLFNKTDACMGGESVWLAPFSAATQGVGPAGPFGFSWLVAYPLGKPRF